MIKTKISIVLIIFLFIVGCNSDINKEQLCKKWYIKSLLNTETNKIDGVSYTRYLDFKCDSTLYDTGYDTKNKYTWALSGNLIYVSKDTLLYHLEILSLSDKELVLKAYYAGNTTFKVDLTSDTTFSKL